MTYYVTPGLFHTFELSPKGSASVLEATAVARCCIRETGRRVIAIAGWWDLRSQHSRPSWLDARCLAEIIGSSQILGGSWKIILDMLLTSHILDRTGINHEESSWQKRAADAASPLETESFQRGFVCGRVWSELKLATDTRTVTFEEFLADSHIPNILCKGYDRSSKKLWKLRSNAPEKP